MGAPVVESASSAIETSTSGTTITVSTPAGTTAGDLLVAQVSQSRSRLGTSAPAGWELLWADTDPAAVDARMVSTLYYKVAGSSEPADHTFTQVDDDGRIVAGIVRISGFDPADPFDGEVGRTFIPPLTGGDNIEAPSVPVSGPDRLVLRMFFAVRTGTITMPGGLTQSYYQPSPTSGRPSTIAGWENVSSVPTGAVTATMSNFTAGDARVGYTLAINPADGGEPTEPEPPWTLTTNVVGNGTVAKDPDTADYADDTNVQVTAVPASGWVFVGWSGDLAGDANPATVTMDGDKTVTATFVEAPPIGTPANPSVVFDRIEAGRVYFELSADTVDGADHYQGEGRIRAGTDDA